MNNLELYNKVRTVPQEAQKTIAGGRLKGMTDINPMWRIKTLTDNFGICGIGWKYTIDHKWIEQGANNEQCAFVQISLYIKVDGQWSDAIQGIGGSGFVNKEKDYLYTSDECYKMAVTDAISVACKMLGMGADIYWQKDSTKYYTQSEQVSAPQTPSPSDDNRPWFNLKDKAGNYTSEGQKAFDAIASGLRTIQDLESKFKISKDTKAELIKAVNIFEQSNRP